MKRLFFTLLLGTLISSVNLSAQNSTFHISVVPPLSSNGSRAALYTNDVSLNILVGISRNERSLTLGGLANIVRHNANGFQAAGLCNHIGHNANGFQSAGLFNYLGGGGRGALASGLVNFVEGHYAGAQLAGLANTSLNMLRGGAQVAGLANVTGVIRGAQVAGIVNVSSNMMGGGAQVAGLANVTGVIRGAQVAGLANVAGAIRGAQVAGIVNVSGNTLGGGTQVAGLANVAGVIRGVQVAGLVNVAGLVRGVQIGIVNVARNSDLAIGLVNISRNGEMGIGLGYNEIGTASINFRSGGRVLYGIVGAGWNHRVENNGEAIGFTGGLGVHINIMPWMRINSELTHESLCNFNNNRNNNTFKSGFALMPAFRVGRVEIFGGPSINYMHTERESMRTIFVDNPLWEKTSRSGRFQQLFIGWQAGVQFLINKQW